MIRLALGLALPLALVGCGPSETAADAEATTAPSTNPAIERLEGIALVVDANGLGPKGEPMRFGAARADVDQAVERAYGSAPEKSRNAECGAGPMEFSKFGPLQIAYMDGEMRGWFLDEGEKVATSDGVQPGTTTLDALRQESRVQQLDTTLEGEFQYTTADYGTITGFADPAGTITGLAAGVTCFFR